MRFIYIAISIVFLSFNIYGTQASKMIELLEQGNTKDAEKYSEKISSIKTSEVSVEHLPMFLKMLECDSVKIKKVSLKLLHKIAFYYFYAKKSDKAKYDHLVGFEGSNKLKESLISLLDSDNDFYRKESVMILALVFDGDTQVEEKFLESIKTESNDNVRQNIISSLSMCDFNSKATYSVLVEEANSKKHKGIQHHINKGLSRFGIQAPQ